MLRKVLADASADRWCRLSSTTLAAVNRREQAR